MVAERTPMIMAIALAVMVGAAAFAAAPRRAINRAFFVTSLVCAAWGGALTIALGRSAEVRPWISLTAAIGGFFPAQLWWMKHCLLRGSEGYRPSRWSAPLWRAISFVLVAICFLPGFVLAGSTGLHPIFGPVHVAYVVGILVAYGALLVQTLRELRHLDGIARIELQILLFGGVSVCVTGLAITSIAALFGAPPLGLAPLDVVLFYALTAWAISTHRIFVVRDLVLAAVRWLTIGLVLSLWLALWERIAAGVLPWPSDTVLGVGTALLLFVVLEPRLKRLFAFNLIRNNDAARRQMLVASRQIIDVGALQTQLEAVLREWSRAERVEILVASETEADLVGTTLNLRGSDPIADCLRRESWTSPEREARRRGRAGIHSIDSFLHEHRLGAIVAAPASEDRGLALVICLSRKRDRRPYAWAEIQFLLDAAEICEGALARSRLAAKAREAEQMATVGMMSACIAHEIRNPLVALSAAAQMLESKHSDPNFRSTLSMLLSREVGRIQRLAEQLRALSKSSSGRIAPAAVNSLVKECVDLLQARAAEHRAALIFTEGAGTDTIAIDRDGLKQVVINLLTNAIDAVSDNVGARNVAIATTCHSSGHLLIDVTDNGRGLSDEQKARLFKPFTSTKANGFGLGLAFSARIVRSMKGTLSLVDHAGAGAAFRVSLPTDSPLEVKESTTRS